MLTLTYGTYVHSNEPASVLQLEQIRRVVEVRPVELLVAVRRARARRLSRRRRAVSGHRARRGPRPVPRQRRREPGHRARRRHAHALRHLERRGGVLVLAFLDHRTRRRRAVPNAVPAPVLQHVAVLHVVRSRSVGSVKFVILLQQHLVLLLLALIPG